MVQVPVLAIHGGAGTINREALSAEAEREYRGALQSILEKGRDALAAGASALDAVTLAVSMLEDCPLFNAGRGAVYTSAETHEMDAAIMDGSTLRTGALSCVHGVKNPIRAARVVMEQSPHVLMTSDGAMAFLREDVYKRQAYVSGPPMRMWPRPKAGSLSPTPSCVGVAALA